MMYFISYCSKNASSVHFYDNIIYQHPLEWIVSNSEYALLNWKKIPEDEEHDVEKWIVAREQRNEAECDEHTRRMIEDLKYMSKYMTQGDML